MIKVKVLDKELTVEEAKKVYEELEALFAKPEPYPLTPTPVPIYPSIDPWRSIGTIPLRATWERYPITSGSITASLPDGATIS